MTVGSILLGLALLVGVGLYVTRPLMSSERRSRQRITKRQALLAEKEATLAQIRKLDFDHDTGKVQDEEYQLRRAEFMAEATALLKQLDEIGETADAGEWLEEAKVVGQAPDIDAAIEAAVARRRVRPGPSAPAKAAPQTNGKARYCPQCGQQTDPDDRFCARCGHSLLQPQRA